MISFIAAICLAVILLFAILSPLFRHRPEEPAVTRPEYKKPDPADYKKIIEESKAEYESFMQQQKNRMPEQR